MFFLEELDFWDPLDKELLSLPRCHRVPVGGQFTYSPALTWAATSWQSLAQVLAFDMQATVFLFAFSFLHHV